MATETIEKLLRLRAWFAVRTVKQSGGTAGWVRPGDPDCGETADCLSTAWTWELDELTDDNGYTMIREAAIRLFPSRTDKAGGPSQPIYAFNDHPDTTHADVMLVIDAALAAAGYDIPIASVSGAETLVVTGA